MPIQPPSKAREWSGLIALMIGFAGLFLTYNPPLAGIEDEVGFLNQALVWSRGAISAEGAGYTDLADFGLIGGRHLAARHPGRSLLALPFLMVGGLRSVYVSGLMVHLAMTAIGGLLLSRLGKSPLWAVLLLFHPTLAIYSRTIMADGPAGAGLLLAGLFLTVPGRRGAIGAGLAIGLAALMRYHAGLVLPIVVGVMALDRERPRRMRDALLCFAAGSIAGGLIVAYNLIVYGTVLDPFTAGRGTFSARFLWPNGLFYAGALMMIWPLMLIAPLLDRSRLRWLVRGVVGLFLGSAILYYFHDRGTSWLQTAVLGQRLIQVALPLWIVSYALVIEDRVGRPSRVILTMVGVGLLMANGLIFETHQRHLKRLLSAREALVQAVPAGSLIVVDGSLRKLFGVPVGVPTYRWHDLTYQGTSLIRPGDPILDREPSRWFLAILDARGDGTLPDAAMALIEHYRMVPVPSGEPGLALFGTAYFNGSESRDRPN